MHPALEIELAKRQRTWGADNQLQLRAMRVEQSMLASKPGLLAQRYGRLLAGRTPLAANNGSYRRIGPKPLGLD